MKKDNTLLNSVSSIIVLIVVLLIWYLISAFELFPAYAFPSSASVFNAFREELSEGRLLNDIVASLWRVAIGFILSTILGVPIGLWLGLHLRARQALVPMLNFFRFLSPLAW